MRYPENAVLLQTGHAQQDSRPAGLLTRRSAGQSYGRLYGRPSTKFSARPNALSMPTGVPLVALR